MIKREELTNPQSCMSRALDDEMTFVLLGRDPAAPAAIRFWIEERVRLGKNRPVDSQIHSAYQDVETMNRDRKRIRAALSAPAPSPSPAQGGAGEGMAR